MKRRSAWKKQHESPETDVKKQRRHVRLVLPQKQLERLLKNVVVLAAPNKSPQFDVPGMPLSTKSSSITAKNP
jgi:hypothetical protein